MDAETDYELSPDQWKMLKTLRLPAQERRRENPLVLAELMSLGLVAFNGDVAVITPKGRKVLVRGSEKLLDLAA
jgi:hypothetical protein